MKFPAEGLRALIRLISRKLEDKNFSQKQRCQVEFFKLKLKNNLDVILVPMLA